MYDEHLESFRSRVKIRGNTVSEKLTFTLDRWRKVVKDSEGDMSGYRQQFSEMHRKLLSQVSSMTDEADEACRASGLDMMIEDLKNTYLYADARITPGILDGMCYIICELELVIAGQQDV